MSGWTDPRNYFINWIATYIYFPLRLLTITAREICLAVVAVALLNLALFCPLLSKMNPRALICAPIFPISIGTHPSNYTLSCFILIYNNFPLQYHGLCCLLRSGLPSVIGGYFYSVRRNQCSQHQNFRSAVRLRQYHR